ncbi:hypothetical protein HQQ94_07165 [Shewanella sp. VB17]|uniref:hypothetical protein n=1 Tax=Shewanella sp. VB17 TaxID=2739432 RepID=UPI0015662246|nr:hypothetical protein [Shewanella sp. VB17]NRD73022.1 hypothetical protein [Shewanella sp. VB17]
MPSSADVTSGTDSTSDSDAALGGSLDSAVELASKSLLTSGESAQCDNFARIGLAPRPSNTGREPLCISAFLSSKTRQFIEFSFVSTNVHAAQMLIWVRVLILCMILYGMWELTMERNPLLLLPMTLPLLMGFSLWFWLEQQDMAREASSQLPLRVHGQRQEVILSRPQANQPIPQRPSLMGSHWSIFLLISAFFLFSIGGIFLLGQLDGQFLFMEFKSSRGLKSVFIPGLILFLLSFIPLYKLAQPWRQYFSDKKGLVVSEELLAVPWEKLAIEYQSSSMMSLFTATNMQFLVLSAPDVNDPSNSIAAVSIPVHSQEEAFCLYEFIRQYMDEYQDTKGQDNATLAALDVAEPEYNRAGYQRLLQQRWQYNPVSYFLWRGWYWLTLRYLAHWMLEYHHDIMPAKVRAREDLQTWSAALPEAQWKTTSAALKTLNQTLEALYQQGHQWESEPVQAILAQQRHRGEERKDVDDIAVNKPLDK